MQPVLLGSVVGSLTGSVGKTIKHDLYFGLGSNGMLYQLILNSCFNFCIPMDKQMQKFASPSLPLLICCCQQPALGVCGTNSVVVEKITAKDRISSLRRGVNDQSLRIGSDRKLGTTKLGQQLPQLLISLLFLHCCSLLPTYLISTAISNSQIRSREQNSVAF